MKAMNRCRPGRCKSFEFLGIRCCGFRWSIPFGLLRGVRTGVVHERVSPVEPGWPVAGFSRFAPFTGIWGKCDFWAVRGFWKNCRADGFEHLAVLSGFAGFAQKPGLGGIDAFCEKGSVWRFCGFWRKR